MSDPDTLARLATDVAVQAGELLLERFGGPQSGVESKTSRTDLVSDADRDAEALILSEVRSRRPDDAILAEEGGGRAGATGVRWLVDPLDGTVNYLWGIPHWSVSVAALDDDGGIAAVVHDPCRGETHIARRGGGAWLGGRRLRLDPLDDPAEAMLGTGFAYVAAERARQAEVLRTLLPRVRDIRRAGSAALDLAWVAAGRLDAYYETGLSPWDWEAGAMLVREAGGAIRAIDATDAAAAGLLATRPGLDGPLVRLLDDAFAAATRADA